MIFKPFNDDGNLLIGISASDAPRRLNLFFDMVDQPTKQNGPPTNLNWSFLSGAEWIPLSRDKIVHDGTKGFFALASLLYCQMKFLTITEI